MNMEKIIDEQTTAILETSCAEKGDIGQLKRKHELMKDLPFLKTHEMTDNFTGDVFMTEEVSPSTIIAAPNLNNWAAEYHKDWKEGEELTSVEAMAIKIGENAISFWKENQSPVKLTKITGPCGPIYAVEDGSHRVAAAKLAGAITFPAEVSDLTNRQEFSTLSDVTVEWWRALIFSGAVKGEIEERGKEKILVLEETPEIPWIVRSRTNFMTSTAD